MEFENKDAGEHSIKLTNIERIIAKTMTKSKQEIPHFYMSTELDFANFINLKNNFEKSANQKVTITPLLVKVISKILKEFPILNAHFIEEGLIKTFDTVNIGVATATERGLIVPVIKDVNNKNLETILVELKELTQRAHNGRSSIDDLEGGTFTLSNAGMFGAYQVLSIINPPETAILSIGAMINRPVVDEGEIVIRPIVQSVLSADHRIVDGKIAGKFLSLLKFTLENMGEL